jgi:hypothetical protein
MSGSISTGHAARVDMDLMNQGESLMANNNNAGAAGGGALYGLGIFGAWVYFWQQADGFWEYVLAVLQGIVWPAIMVYEVFSALG